jgi:hypothetical protein
MQGERGQHGAQRSCGERPAGHGPGPPARACGVRAWRRELLRRAGLAPRLARTVAADERIDLHALLGLLERGCPPHLALRIVAPLDAEEGPLDAGDGRG